jgi:hypothetical protein
LSSATTPEPMPADALLTERQLADRWQLSPGTLANQRSTSRGCAWVRIGGSVRYRFSDVLAYEKSVTP